jgi:nicotinamide riboside kinase
MRRRRWVDVLTREFLEEQYIQLKKSVYQIAKELGCDGKTVYDYLDFHQIERLPSKLKARGSDHWQWQGHGRIPKTYWSNVRNGARMRKIPFALIIEEAWELYLAQEGRCALTGQEIGFESHKSNTASLDRISPDAGYHVGNVQWLHRDVNCAKQSLTNTEFIDLCRAVADYALSSKEPAHRTLMVNLLAGPGVGKSTIAAGLFAKLKLSGVDAEFVNEYAKQKTWVGDMATLSVQPYVTGKQYYKQAIIDGKVECAITDSPFLLGILYQGRGCTKTWDKWVVEVYEQFDNLNVFLVRNQKNAYNPNGRSQTFDEAVAKDQELKSLLNAYNLPYIEELADGEACIERLKTIILERLGRTWV